MTKIREVKTRSPTKNGEKYYSKAVVTILKIFLQLLHWDYGDEIKIDVDMENLNDRHIKIRKVNNR